MAQLIALTDDAHQTFRTILGAQPVRVTAIWNPSDEYWYVSLANVDRTAIVTGRRLVEAGRPLRGRVLDFEGELYVDGNGEPGRNAWASTHRLLYLTPSELGDA